MYLFAGVAAYGVIQNWVCAGIAGSRTSHLLFAGMCLSAVLFAVFGAEILHATAAPVFLQSLRRNITFALVLVTLFLWFVAAYTGRRPLPFLIGLTLITGALGAANLVLPDTLQYDRFDGIQRLRLPWGELVTRGKGHNGPWACVTIAAIVAIYAFAMYALTDLYRRTGQRSAAWMLFAAALFVACALEGMLTRLGLVHFIPLGPYGFLLMVAVMGTTLTGELQRQLRTSESNLRAILRNASDGIHIVDSGGRLIEASNTFCDMLGYTRDELLGMHATQWDTRFADTDFGRDIAAQLTRPTRSQVETRHRRKDGSAFDVEVSGFPLELNGRPVMYNSSRDITERKAIQNQIQRLAFYDQLTDLPNRRLLDDRLNQVLASSARTGCYGALLLIDLDDFKTINDSVGHLSGDLMLTQIAGRLAAFIRKSDTAARLGGDEFIVLLSDLGEDRDDAVLKAQSVGEKVLQVLNRPYLLGSREFRSSCSVGVTVFCGDEVPPAELTQQADIAMYQAKNGGRNNLRFFDPEMQTSINRRASLEADLHQAIDAGQFDLHYQVQVDGASRPVGAEGLIRWRQPQRGLVTPDHFIPLAEETGLIIPIGRWVLDSACRRLKAWQRHPLTREWILAVNVSSKEFRNAGFIDHVRAAVTRHEINPALLRLELTESMLLDGVEDTIAIMNALKRVGITFSLDDFGTGYSSLQYLKRLPLDELKIDQSFVRDIAVDANDRAIVHTIIAMADRLNLSVIAEGVETPAQRDLLAAAGCRRFQGYLFGRPAPAQNLEPGYAHGMALEH